MNVIQMEATKENIQTIMGQEAKHVTMEPKKKGNGYVIKGLVRRNTLLDLMNNFHPYIGKRGFLVVVTPGTLGPMDDDDTALEVPAS